MNIKKKILTIIAIVAFIWWITPIPEGTILLVLVTGGTVSLTTGNWEPALLFFLVSYQPMNWFMETYIAPKICERLNFIRSIKFTILKATK